MREQLNHRITIARRVRRISIPALAAAAVIALASGGYALANTDGTNQEPNLTPVGGDQTQRTESKQKAEKPAPTASRPITKPRKVYQDCNQLVQDYHTGVPETAGKLAVENDLGVTVVVANDIESFTCSFVDGRESVGHPEALDGAAQAEDYWTGHSGVFQFSNRWAGGQVPEGVTGVSYDFGGGHTAEAVLQDGFWAMQYFSEDPLPDAEIEVTLEGPNGQTFTLPEHAVCDQVNHGC